MPFPNIFSPRLLTSNVVALDGGTQVVVFILSFAVQGAAGTAHLFPQWWGANQAGNYDHCLRFS